MGLPPKSHRTGLPTFSLWHFLDPEDQDADLNQAAGMGLSAPFILDSATLYASVFSSVKRGSGGGGGCGISVFCRNHHVSVS